MAHPLDTLDTYARYDVQDIGYGIEHFPEQFLIAKKEMRSFVIPVTYKKITRVVLVGMGGSHLGMDVIRACAIGSLKKPVDIVSDYMLPGYVNYQTLVILSSFSGTTEEVLEVARRAEKARAKICVLTSGGDLARMAQRKKWPLYQFIPGELAVQPRLGIGFSFVGFLHVLKSCGVLTVSVAQVDAMIDAMVDVIDTCALEISLKENPAKQVAQALKNAPVLIVAAEHLAGNAIVLQNQLQETAKVYAHVELLPEMNHHFLEGLSLPKAFFAQWSVLMLCSTHYHARTQKRLKITADILEKQGGHIVEYMANGASVWEEISEVLQFGMYASYYQAMLHEVKPEEIPFVKRLKEKMKK